MIFPDSTHHTTLAVKVRFLGQPHCDARHLRRMNSNALGHVNNRALPVRDLCARQPSKATKTEIPLDSANTPAVPHSEDTASAVVSHLARFNSSKTFSSYSYGSRVRRSPYCD